MLYTSEVDIAEVFVHYVGNKTNEDGIKISDRALNLDESINAVLNQYFFNSFKDNAYYHFDHDTALDMNEMYRFASEIFRDPTGLAKQSENIVRHLYRCSDHPNIKPGEVCVAYFENVQIEGEVVDALGIFKSEQKDAFLRVVQQGQAIGLEPDEGISAGRLDKGCLIFNRDAEDGYVVAVVDQTNKGIEARYWSEEFLYLKHRRDVYFNTQNILSACKDFVTEELPEQYDMEKADQIDLLNKSIKYFKENDRFVQEEFEGAVFKDEELIQSFQSFTKTFGEETDTEMPQSFDIAKDVVRKKGRVFKSVLKLDKNFHIYIHGNRDMIERGVDENGRKYYKVYYENES